MTDLTKYFIDLSKCSEEQYRCIGELFNRYKESVYVILRDDLRSGFVDEDFKFLHFDLNEWVRSSTPLKHKTELTYDEFIRLFEGGEGEKKSRVVRMTDEELTEALRVETAELEALQDSVGNIETEIFYRRNPDHRK